jgi:hypothetical protein
LHPRKRGTLASALWPRSGEGSAIYHSPLQAITHGVKGIFFRMDRKTKILIASLLGRIEITPKKKAGFLDSYDLGRILPSMYHSPLHSTPSNNERTP